MYSVIISRIQRPLRPASVFSMSCDDDVIWRQINSPYILWPIWLWPILIFRVADMVFCCGRYRLVVADMAVADMVAPLKKSTNFDKAVGRTKLPMEITSWSYEHFVFTHNFIHLFKRQHNYTQKNESENLTNQQHETFKKTLLSAVNTMTTY